MPRLLTPDEIDKAAKMYGLGLTIKQIGSVLGISKATMERRVNDQEGVAEALEKGKANTSAALRQNAFRMAMNGDTAMTIFLLKTREGFREMPKEVNLKIGELDKLPAEKVIELGREAIKFLEDGDGEGE